MNSADAIVLLTLRDKDEGGRQFITPPEYRAKIVRDDQEFDVCLKFLNGIGIEPGGQGEAELWFSHPDAHLGRIYHKAKFRVIEGTGVVGRIFIKRVMNLFENARRANPDLKGSVLCRRCGACFRLPRGLPTDSISELDWSIYSSPIEAMDILHKKGHVDLRIAKAVAMHMSKRWSFFPRGFCHRCSAILPRGKIVNCSKCDSLNLTNARVFI